MTAQARATTIANMDAPTRNITTHTYDHQKARQVYEGTQAFMLDARTLLARLEDSGG